MVNYAGLNPIFAARISAAIADAEAATGGKAVVRSAYRTYGDQSKAYARYKASGFNPHYIAAPPGKSLHEQGMAFDLAPGPVRDWIQAHAAKYGLEAATAADRKRGTWGNDAPHIQLARGVLKTPFDSTPNAFAEGGRPLPGVPVDPFGVVMAKESGALPAGKASPKTLRKGMSGPEVAALGGKLSALGYDVGTPVDRFGPKMQTAVRNYETDNHLRVDRGVAGPQVLAALNPAPPAYAPGGGEIAAPAYSPGGGEMAAPAYSPGGSVASTPFGVGSGAMPGAGAIPPTARPPTPEMLAGGLGSAAPQSQMPSPPAMLNGVLTAGGGVPGAAATMTMVPTGPRSVPTSSVGPDPTYGDDAVLAATRGTPGVMPERDFNMLSPDVRRVMGLGPATPRAPAVADNERDWNMLSPDVRRVMGLGPAPQAPFSQPRHPSTPMPTPAGPIDAATIALLQRNVPGANDPLSNWQRDQLAGAMASANGSGAVPAYARGFTGAPPASGTSLADVIRGVQGIPAGIAGGAESAWSGIRGGVDAATQAAGDFLGFGSPPVSAQPSLYDRVPPAVPAPGPQSSIGGYPQIAGASPGFVPRAPIANTGAQRPSMGGIPLDDIRSMYANGQRDIPPSDYGALPSRFTSRGEGWQPFPSGAKPALYAGPGAPQSIPQSAPMLSGSGSDDTLRGSGGPFTGTPYRNPGPYSGYPYAGDPFGAAPASAAPVAPATLPAAGDASRVVSQPIAPAPAPYMYNAPATGSGLASGYLAPKSVGLPVGAGAGKVSAIPASKPPGSASGAPGGTASGHGGYVPPSSFGGSPGAYSFTGVTPWGGASYSMPGGGVSLSPFTPDGYTAPNYNPVSGGALYAYHPNGQGGGTFVTSDGRTMTY